MYLKFYCIQRKLKLTSNDMVEKTLYNLLATTRKKCKRKRGTQKDFMIIEKY